MISKPKHHASIVYPETDGMPLPDGEFQAPLYREIVSTLSSHFKDTPNCNVNGDTFIYYQEGDPQRRVAPDCYVAFDIDKDIIERFNTYLLWEVGKPPDFVLEIGSPSTARNDLFGKRRLYASIGVTEYWRFDSTGGDFYGAPLAGERLAGDEYHPLPLHTGADSSILGHSPTLALDLVWQEGRLRFYNPQTRTWLLSQDEERSARQAAEAAHETERNARQAAEARAQSSEARALALEAELRRLRGESP